MMSSYFFILFFCSQKRFRTKWNEAMAGYDRQTPSVNCCLAPIETWGLRPKKPSKKAKMLKIHKKTKQMLKEKTNKQKYFHDSRQVRRRKVCWILNYIILVLNGCVLISRSLIKKKSKNRKAFYWKSRSGNLI